MREETLFLLVHTSDGWATLKLIARNSVWASHGVPGALGTWAGLAAEQPGIKLAHCSGGLAQGATPKAPVLPPDFRTIFTRVFACSLLCLFPI